MKETKERLKLRHKLVYDIETRFNQFSLNTVISGFMEYNNKLSELAKKEGGIDKETLKTFVILLAPFAPHLGEELWSCLLYTSGTEAAALFAQQQLYDQQHHHADHHRPDDLCSVFHGKACADVISQDVAYGAWTADGKGNVSRKDVADEGGIVGDCLL